MQSTCMAASGSSVPKYYSDSGARACLHSLSCSRLQSPNSQTGDGDRLAHRLPSFHQKGKKLVPETEFTNLPIPPLIPPPILNLGERNTENCSNQTLIWFLTLGELSSGARDLLHLGALLRTLIRARRATTGLPAPPGTSPRLPSAPPQSQRPCLAARPETKAWREREGQ